MVMEKSRNMKHWPKVMEFVISHGLLPICPRIVPDLFLFFFHHKEIKQRSRKSAFYVNATLGREMVIENQETVMEKSWKHILSSL